jgi:hypothetical protein
MKSSKDVHELYADQTFHFCRWEIRDRHPNLVSLYTSIQKNTKEHPGRNSSDRPPLLFKPAQPIIILRVERKFESEGALSCAERSGK